MKKTLDATTIVNELRGQSAFFPTHQTEQPQEPQSQRYQEPEQSHRKILSSAVQPV